jgi:type I restriction enzyme R subunit
MGTQSEAMLENNLMSKLKEMGYEEINIHNENALKENLKLQLEKFNNTTLTDKEFNKILIHLESGNVFTKAEKLRDSYELDREDGTKYIRFLNKKDWCENYFQIANQITFERKYSNRYDVTILINGLPLLQIELKKRGMPIKEAFNQISRYHKHSYRGLFGYIQIFVISNGVNTKYFANNKDQTFKFTFSWKDKENNNINQLDKFAEIFLEPCHLSKMIGQYIVLNQTEKKLMVFRAYQYYAVEALVDRAINTNLNGYIWHTTGSGKTLTSFKVSEILANEPNIDKVIFVVDRINLDYQTTNEFNSFAPDSVDGTDNTISLIKTLKSKSKLIITTIQKLNIAVTRRKKSINNVADKKIVLIFDECHRSQFGDMHRNITNFFNNIQYFGFTGTPIYSVNANDKRTTHDIFGKQLHNYVIKDAIADDNVLGFSVEYWGKGYVDNVDDKKVISIDKKEYLESSGRLNKIVDFILSKHKQITYDKEFNALFAVSSIDILKRYYEIFKTKKSDLKIATIFSFNPNEELEPDDQHSRDFLENAISDYNALFETNFSTEDFGNYYVDVSKRSKNKEIDILLVVDMFLTSFDSKFLNTLYVDKNLKYHNLIEVSTQLFFVYHFCSFIFSRI